MYVRMYVCMYVCMFVLRGICEKHVLHEQQQMHVQLGYKKIFKQLVRHP